MRLRVLAMGMVLLTAGAFAAPLASAQVDGDDSSATVTATITGDMGVRYVSSVPAIAMSSVLSSTTLSATYTVLTQETVRAGTNPWTVTGRLQADLSDGASPTPNTIARSAMNVSGRTASVTVGSGGTPAPGSGTEDMSADRTLFTVSGENTSTLYTATYTAGGTLTLTPPAGTVTGAYTGTFVVTLV